MVKRYGLVLCLLLFLVLFVHVPVGHADSSNWWNASWGYRQSHTITSLSGAGVGYQINLTANYGSGSSSGNTVYLNNHSNSDFSDLRFISIDNSTVYEYWVESYTASSSAFVWVRINEDLGTANRVFWVYYGNGAATSLSNGEQTFISGGFDDFNDASVNASKWNNVIGTPAESGGYLNLTCSGTTIRVNSTATFNANTALRMKAQSADQSGSEEQNWGYGYPVETDNKAGSFSTYGNGRLVTRDSAFNLPVWTENKNAIYDILRNGTGTGRSMRFYVNNAEVTNSPVTTQIPATNITIGLAAYSLTGSYLWVDWVLIRVYIAPDASHGAWTSEDGLLVYVTFAIYPVSLLMVNATYTNNGTVSYAPNTVLALASVPEANYTFQNFTWDLGSSTSNPYNLTASQNLTVTVYIGEGGNVTVVNGTTYSRLWYILGLTAIPGYFFAAILGIYVLGPYIATKKELREWGKE